MLGAGVGRADARQRRGGRRGERRSAILTTRSTTASGRDHSHSSLVAATKTTRERATCEWTGAQSHVPRAHSAPVSLNPHLGVSCERGRERRRRQRARRQRGRERAHSRVAEVDRHGREQRLGVERRGRRRQRPRRRRRAHGAGGGGLVIERDHVHRARVGRCVVGRNARRRFLRDPPPWRRSGGGGACVRRR